MVPPLNLHVGWIVRTYALSLVLVGLVIGQAHAQLPKYNPYAPQEEVLPVAADGTLNWPSFFKDKAMHDRFQGYFAIGACVGTNQVINNKLKGNEVDVNQLPDAAVQGQAASLTTGIVTITDAAGKKTIVVTHPAGVSKVNVSGPMPAKNLKTDMVVRFVGKVDAHGMGATPVETLDVVTPAADFKWQEIEADKLETVTAKIVKITGRKLLVQVPAGKLRRLTYMLAEEPKVNVEATNLALTSAGDAVTAKGHSYRGPGAGGLQVVFASEVSVTKALAAAANQTAVK